MKPIGEPRAHALDQAPRSRRVLALTGDNQVGLWLTRSLGRAGLTVFSVCISPRGLAAHSRYGSGAWAVESGPRTPEFVGEVEELARRLDVGSIITIDEECHLSLIENRDRFEPDIHLFSPSADCFAKAVDKDYMNSLCLRLGVPVARGTTLDLLMADSGRLGLNFPLVLRTRKLEGLGGGAEAPWKAAYAEDAGQLADLYKQLQDRAPNIVVQEYHPGAEDHVQVLMHQGEAFMVGEYIGEHHMPLAGGVTVQRVTCRHEDVIRDAVRLLQAIGWEGIAGCQFHYDTQTGKYIFLEVNPRFIGGLPTVIMAGFDAPFLQWQSHFEPDRMVKTQYRLGVRSRILGGDVNWMLAMIRGDPLSPGQKRIGRLSTIARFLWNCGSWTHDDTFWWRDPKPFWVDLALMARKIRARSVDLIGKPEKQGYRA
jgi:predicted ATP-grasp superfamily ATP-dependent carboligase